jgi:succinate dehydrogenase/fumarate reductase flavoprotein subunit
VSQTHRRNPEIGDPWEAIQLVTLDENNPRRIAGALAMNREGNIEAFAAENVVFAVGGPGGIYKTSVYPAVHFGAIGLALMVGARARNLPESQYGMASIKFRWNVSGSYMQVIPRFISRAADGKTDEREFLRPYFTSDSELNGLIFLKGYQWPFDAGKVIGGSSVIDILVYIETMVKNRRVYLDFRSNPEGFSFNGLPEEAQTYLTRSKAVQSTPIERLQAMNPNAIELYREHAIDLHLEPLEIAVCAQHNNGGLAGNLWWESINISHLFPVGEVNGSHGVNRPGGSALNSGQVGGYRLAEFIANRYPSRLLDEAVAEKALISSIKATQEWIHNCSQATKTWRKILKEIQARMTLAGGHIRSKETMEIELQKARNLVVDIMQKGCRYSGKRQLREAFRIRHLCYAHAVYLDAINYEQQCNVGSRGSSLVVDPTGRKIHQLLDEGWKMLSEDPSYRAKVLETEVKFDGTINHEWVDCHPIPEMSSWFETIWADFRNGEIYKSW